MIIGHGGNKTALAERLGCDPDQIVDMSSNLNPIGPPDNIEQFIRENVKKIRALPSPDAAGMRKGFARYHDLDEARVVAGNGTTWFIYTIPAAFKARRALIVGPTYSDYRDACTMQGTAYQFLAATAGNNFIPDIDAVSDLAGRSDLVFICNPNNPTGALIDKDRIKHLITRHKDTLFVVDESYLPFSERADETSFVRDTGYKNVLMLSSMSKIFRIPGLRTGFLSADTGLSEKIMARYQPWSVNSLAQAVIEDIFNHPDRIEPFYRETRTFIHTEKERFYTALKETRELELFDTSAYFVLARLNNGDTAPTFCEKIGDHRILIRDCTNFDGLSNQYVRFSLKTRGENEKLARCIRQAVLEGAVSK